MEIIVLRELVNLGSRISMMRLNAYQFKKITEEIFCEIEPTYPGSRHMLRVR